MVAAAAPEISQLEIAQGETVGLALVVAAAARHKQVRMRVTQLVVLEGVD